MTKYTLVLNLLCVGLMLITQPLIGQFGEGVVIQKIKSVYIREADSTSGSTLPEEATPFPNLNTTRYYQDKKMLQRIEKAKDSLKLHKQLLAQYISKFGIENFSKDNHLLWQLARDFQQLKDTTRSLMMYELAVKHSRGTRIPNPTMDSLSLPRRSEYIPLEEYYSLLEMRKRVDTLVPPRKVLVNMGKKINSPAPDYAPYMHPSDSVLIFTSRRGANKEIDYIFTKENEDLYYSIKDHLTGKWSEAEKLSDSISTTKYNEGSACISPDGLKLYFTRCYAPDGMGDCDIYTAEWKGGGWVNIKPLGGKVNSAEWDSHPNLSPDGKMLFFSSVRKGGFGGTDIYFCLRDANGEWATAQNIGPVINTPENEVTPYYHQTTKMLYFGSTGQLRSYGGYDIYKSNWTGLQWFEPQNLGPLVNTKGNEYYFSINGKGETIYYSKSNVEDKTEDAQDFDIFSFSMPMEARPDANTKISGYLIDSVTRKPLVGRVVLVDMDNGIEVAPKKINENGYFEFNVRNNNRYRIYAVGDNYLTIRNDVSLKNNDTIFQVFTESFQQNRPLVFESLEFSENSAELAFTAKPKLDYLGRFLRNYEMFNICIKGHTDSDGGEDYNLKLSQRRANQIKKYLSEVNQIDPMRITTEGYGESRPLVPNDNLDNKKKNRRVEFELRINPAYTGDKILPTLEETRFEEENMLEELEFIQSDDFEPADFLKEFNWEEWEIGEDDPGEDEELEKMLDDEIEQKDYNENLN